MMTFEKRPRNRVQWWTHNYILTAAGMVRCEGEICSSSIICIKLARVNAEKTLVLKSLIRKSTHKQVATRKSLWPDSNVFEGKKFPLGKSKSHLVLR